MKPLICFNRPQQPIQFLACMILKTGLFFMYLDQSLGKNMKPMNWLFRFFLRFRYPVSLPEDIATDLGINTSNFLTFEEFVFQLSCSGCRPRHLTRFMPREAAEAAFQSAQRKECFGRNSLFSYYFHEGWLEFNLYFDEHSRLRRIYLQHKRLASDKGVEIPLNCDIPVE